MLKGTLKKLTGLVAAAAMTLSLSGTVFAADLTANLSVNAKEGNEYTAYQIMTAQISGQDADHQDVYTYTLQDDFKEFFDGTHGYLLSVDNEITDTAEPAAIITTDGLNINTNSTAAAALASALERYALEKGIAGTVLPADLAIGYYVVAETVSKTPVASKPILVDLRHDTAVEPKDDNIPLEKKIVEGERLVDANNVSIGDRISYQVISEIPEYEANVDEKKLSYVFTDTFTHITFNNDLQVYIGESTEALSDSAYTLISDADSKSFTLSLSAGVIKENQGKTVKLTYSGTLTESALVDDPNGNPNRIELDYTNNPNQEDSKGHLEDEVITYTYGFRIRKVDKNDEYKDMAGAAFEVTDKDGKVIGSFEYGNDGSIVNNKGVITLEGNYAVIKGVDAGTYTITETKAPEGYSILGSGVEIEIADGDDTALPTGKAVVKVTTSNASLETKDESTKNVTELQDNGDGTIDVVVKIVNVRGISLPETGSAAMLMCMAGGAAAVLLGGLYFALTRRHRRID